MKSLNARFRLINLAIVALTQVFFHFLVVIPFLLNQGVKPVSTLGIWLIIITTILISAGGYLINDICDKDIDSINKPHKALNNIVFWHRIYKLLFCIGFVLIALLSWELKHSFYLAIYVLSWLILRWYSTALKCRPIIGNALVSAFSASVVLVLIVPYFKALANLELESLDALIRPFSYYFIFAFFTSFIREIVKDMEDLKGDEANNCKTLAVSIGIPKTKFFTILQIILFLFCFGIWQFQYAEVYPLWAIIILNLAVSLPFIYFIKLLNKATISSDFTNISKGIKLSMLFGILFLLMELIIH